MSTLRTICAIEPVAAKVSPAANLVLGTLLLLIRP